MKQILYIPTGEVVTLLNIHNKETNSSINAGEYINSGQFKEEFGEFDFWDDTTDPFELMIKFLIGEIKDGEDLVFGEHLYEHLKISEQHISNLMATEFEIMEV